MNIQVIGAGGWGLALSRLLAINGHCVHLWCRKEMQADELRNTRRSAVYLPGVTLPENVFVTRELDAAASMMVVAVPSHAMRSVLQSLPIPEGTIMVSVVKGIENDTLLRMSEVIAACVPDRPVVVLSGPSHAEEVARGMPASVVAASMGEDCARTVQEAFISPNFRVYTSSDVIGVELGGALKNVIAIAAGACDGLGLGDNAKAALITRGLAEIARLGVACGALPLTFAGLSGMGDLIVTCASRHSRNRRIGEAIARGDTMDTALAASPMVAEGVRTARAAHALARQRHVDMPITRAVHAVLYEGASPRDAVGALMQRDARAELG